VIVAVLASPAYDPPIDVRELAVVGDPVDLQWSHLEDIMPWCWPVGSAIEVGVTLLLAPLTCAPGSA